MAKTYVELQRQIAQLQQEAEQLRKKEAEDVLGRIQEAIAVYGFTAADLGFGKPIKGIATKAAGGKRGRKPRKAVAAAAAAAAASAPKFKDDQGNVWSGRGPRPAWFKAALEAGKSSDELLA